MSASAGGQSDANAIADTSSNTNEIIAASGSSSDFPVLSSSVGVFYDDEAYSEES